MPTVQPFTRDMIRAFLQKRSYRFLTDSDGDFVLNFAYIDEVGGEISIYFVAAGQNGYIYSIDVTSNIAIPRSEFSNVAMICNEWNRVKRWPCAYLANDPNANKPSAKIVLQANYDLEQGIHPELFEDLTSSIISGGYQFFKWLHEEKGF